MGGIFLPIGKNSGRGSAGLRPTVGSCWLGLQQDGEEDKGREIAWTLIGGTEEGVSGALSQWPLRLTAFSAGPAQTRDPQGVDHQGT